LILTGKECADAERERADMLAQKLRDAGISLDL
jgi:hypothetical protein